MLVEIDAEMLLTDVAGDNLGREFEKRNPGPSLLFREKRRHRFPCPFGETMEEIPENRPPLPSIRIYFGREITGARHLIWDS